MFHTYCSWIFSWFGFMIKKYLIETTTKHMFVSWMFAEPFFWVALELSVNLNLFSGPSSILESSSSHAMILLQQQQMKFKQPGHVSRSGRRPTPPKFWVEIQTNSWLAVTPSKTDMRIDDRIFGVLWKIRCMLCRKGMFWYFPFPCLFAWSEPSHGSKIQEGYQKI